MLIVRGIYRRLLRTEDLAEPCFLCLCTGKHQLHIYQDCMHVYWIPFFPHRKKGTFECGHCGQTLEPEFANPGMKERYRSTRKKCRTPLFMFTGPAIFTLLLVHVLFIAPILQRNAIMEHVNHPRPGDVYSIVQEKKYFLLRIERVSGDTVFMRQSKLSTDKRRGLKDGEFHSKDAYSAFTKPFLRSELIEMYDKNELLEVDAE